MDLESVVTLVEEEGESFSWIDEDGAANHSRLPSNSKEDTIFLTDSMVKVAVFPKV
jgi:hypothetical protein